MTIQTASPALSNRLVSLVDRISRLAHSLDTMPDVEYDDLVSNMTLRILERGIQKPEVLNENDSYLVIDAYQNTLHLREAAIVYRKYNAVEMYQVGEDEEVSIIENTASNTISPEDQLIYKEMAESIRERISHLSPECVDLIKYSVSGLTDAEIAVLSGVSRSAISQRRDTIRKALAGVR